MEIRHDVTDVELDCYYFWGVENNENSPFNDKIYRNVNVNNVAFAFAMLGTSKSVLIVWVFRVFIK